MSQAATDFRIGSKIKINLEQVKDRIPNSFRNVLKTEPRCTLIDFKMTDGMGIGVIVELSDGTRGWFFSDEITRA